MIEKHIYVENLDWAITWMFSVEPKDVVAVMLQMERLKFPYSQMKSVRKTIEEDQVNWGITSVNRPLRNMVVIIGNQTSFKELTSSCYHEALHQIYVICEEENIFVGSEDAAYLQGAICSCIADITAHFAEAYYGGAYAP